MKESRKIRVLFTIWSFSAGGGAEKVLANLVNALDKDKYEIDILEFYNLNVKKEHINSNITLLPPVINNGKSIANKIKNKIINKLIFTAPTIIRNSVVKGKEYDIEVAFNYLIPEALISNSDKVYKVGWIHSSIEDLAPGGENYNLNKIQKDLFNKMDNIITISSRTEESLLTLYPEVKEKNIKIYNGYDFNKIIEKSNEKINIKRSEDKVTIIAIGRLVDQKNFLLLIEVAKELKSRNLSFEVLILGEGEQKQLLENKIIEYNLEDNVRLVGFVENPYPYIKIADIFCMTSKAEGFPTVLVESMALGCPFVSTNVAGTQELSYNGACGVVTDDNPEVYASTLIDIISRKEKRDTMSKMCVENVKQYSLENQVKLVENLFDSSLSR